jgi:hypothetical protein
VRLPALYTRRAQSTCQTISVTDYQFLIRFFIDRLWAGVTRNCDLSVSRVKCQCELHTACFSVLMCTTCHASRAQQVGPCCILRCSRCPRSHPQGLVMITSTDLRMRPQADQNEACSSCRGKLLPSMSCVFIASIGGRTSKYECDTNITPYCDHGMSYIHTYIQTYIHILHEDSVITSSKLNAKTRCALRAPTYYPL